jgi:hypothetical protein
MVMKRVRNKAVQLASRFISPANFTSSSDRKSVV